MSENKKRKNKFKGIMWDYYMTNREITKAYDEEYKNRPKSKKWTVNEKIYLALIFIGLIGFVVRFVIM